MNDRPSDSKWVGVLLGLLLSGSAHYLAGQRAAGIKWYVGLLACFVISLALLATPGTVPYLLGVILSFAGLGCWCLMLKQSYRPVPRLRFLGWTVLLLLVMILNIGSSLLARQVIQPFKVPTDAMQPTICGVHGYEVPAGSPDRPGKIERFLSGERVFEVRATTAGVLSAPQPDVISPFTFVYVIGGQPYRLPRFASPFVRPGDPVSVGDILWSGIITSGDRLFVERLSYRFGKPERGDIVVFRSTEIQGLPVNTLYLKRVAGLPGERLRIEPPYLIVNDQKVTQPEIFNIIATNGSNGYAGFQLAARYGFNSGLLTHTSDEIALGQDEYFVLGDNTTNSLDSRFYGPIPRSSILGKATRIYWPLTRINALK